MMIRKHLLILIAVLFFYSGYAAAEISEKEAEQLGGSTLTVIGGEKAGNADGSIPEYTGGISKGADGWYYEGERVVSFNEFDPSQNDKIGIRPNPFKKDRPLYSINSKNMSTYAEKLSPGTQALFKKYPDFRMDVYPTRRSAAYSDLIIEGTKTSALTATIENEVTLNGAHHGIPFPIPKTGIEAVWNHLVRWSGNVEHGSYQSWVINSAGKKYMASTGTFTLEYPYWDIGNPAGDEFLCMIRDQVEGPPNRVGEGLIWKLSYKGSSPAWQYLPGQRRVKRAPEIAYDGPNTSVAGAATYDESYVFNGEPDRFEWKLLGKKEIIIPYNCYKAQYASTPDRFYGPNFVDPSYMRYELHRVWVVEGTLKPGKRHIFQRRVLYIDEDTWYALLHDEFDHNNEVYRVVYDVPVFNYDYPAPFTLTYTGYDLIAGIYYTNAYISATGGIKYIKSLGERQWVPSAMAGRGIR